jgi:hypothetical protein
VLYNTIDAVLARGEKLDDLIDKSDSLSLQVLKRILHNKNAT